MRRTFKIAAAVAVLLPLALAAPTASASTHATRASGATCGPNGPPYSNGECQSGTWAGYLAIGHGPYSKVSAAWMQPAIQPSAGASTYATGIWVGIGGGSTVNPVPVQVGTLMTSGPFAFLQTLGCSGYCAIYETPGTGHVYLSSCVPIEGGGATTPCKVSADDDMYAEVDYLNGSFKMLLADYTANWSWRSGVIQGNYPRDTAEVIVEAPAHGKSSYDLAPFSPVQFNGVNLGLAYGLTMVNGGRTLASVSAPSGCCSFTATFHSSS